MRVSRQNLVRPCRALSPQSERQAASARSAANSAGAASSKKLSCESACFGYVLGKSGNEQKEEASIRFLKYMLSKKVQTRILEETGLTASAGVSYNKFLAKIASELDKPRGFSAIGAAEASSGGKAVAAEFGLPSSWVLQAQMPFGTVAQAAAPVDKQPVDSRVKVFGL